MSRLLGQSLRPAVAGLVWVALVATGRAASLKSDGEQLFKSTIQPIFVEHCHKCHSHQADKIKGGLVVDSLSGLLTGGDTGAAIIPGDPEKSLLIAAIRYTDEDLQMPPKGKKLSDEQISALAQWVKLGAPWPVSDTNKVARRRITEEDRKWWSFQPLRAVDPPRVDDNSWSRNDLDRFIWQKLASENLKPSPEASRQVLIRRLNFDLIGLPPTPGEIDAFVNDTSAEAYERLVDRLLSSPRYGERWARHWLDLARYADSDGYRIDDFRPHAWRYRDYVIAAFNNDKPYDRFVKEQLAGDELWPQEPEAMVATTFLRHWIYEYNNRDVKGQWNTILNDLTDITGDLFLGLGIQCARCHDHKFDPILQKDYYRLQAFFAPILPRDDLPLATPEELASYKEKLQKWEDATAEIRREIAEIEAPHMRAVGEMAIKKFPEDIQELIRKPRPERTPYEHQIADLAYRQVLYEHNRFHGRLKGDEKDRWEDLKKKLAEFDHLKPTALPPVFCATDVGPNAPPTFIPKGRKQEPLEPGFLTLLDEKATIIPAVATNPNSTGRRAALARWIGDPQNRLSTRVIVNRVWQYHFGRGLVGTSSDFGKLGEQPSHPELLDWLARRFVQDGWSFKKLHKLILTSATWRQSAATPATELAKVKDPENRWLWRMNIRRLEAEQIRDALLSTSGELDLNTGGPALDHSRPRRTIYAKVLRNTRDPLLDVFDVPEGFVSTGQRNVTTTPSQALLMMNGPYLLQRARAMAGRLSKEKFANDEELVTVAYRLAFGRAPDSSERTAGAAFLREQAGKVDPAPAGGAPRSIAFESDKMPYREGRAALMQPNTEQNKLEVPNSGALVSGVFTIEAFVLLKSVYTDASVRTIASIWDGNASHPGWSLGVTGRKSRSKPQTLVLQLVTEPMEGSGGLEAVFSGLNIELNKPYFVAATVNVTDTNKTGVTFYSKDLSNDDEPLQITRLAHRSALPIHAAANFTIGGRDTQPDQVWDGLIDDVRLSKSVLKPEQLLLTSESITETTMGFWRFESATSYHKDASPKGNDIRVKLAPPAPPGDPRTAALVDFCHVLLNANEFIYVD
jgi:mono/diheme cytochrome c family protein